MAKVWIEDRAQHAGYRAAVEACKAAKKAGSRRNPPGRWRVRWYDPGGKPKARTFAKLPHAENFLHETEARMRDGSYRDPSAGKVTLAEVAEKWRKTLGELEPTTRETYEDALRLHVLPRWGAYQVRAIEWEDIAEWVDDLASGKASGRPLSRARIQKILVVLSLVLGHAIKTKRIVVNPALGVPLPKKPAPKDHIYLTHADVDRLAEAAGDYRLLILLLAYTGLRWGEMSAVRVGAVNLESRRITIRQAYKKTRGGLVLGQPKTHEMRKVPILRSLAEELEPVVKKRSPEELLFTAPKGGPLYGDNFRGRVFNKAVKAAGLADKGVTPHGLRHTAASLAIASGADVKVVQTMLGHASATMTLDLYGHLFPDRLDEVADRLDRERARRAGLRAVAEVMRARLEALGKVGV